MALTQVRAKLGSVWTVLTYNAATGRYEGSLTPTGTSINQSGGYYNVTVEAKNNGGGTAAISGTELKSLRLVVRETVSPGLTLVSPAPGYLKVNRPAVVMNAVDEAGGSGVNPNSFAVSLDGAIQTAGKTTAAISGGYRLTWTPPAALGEGRHVVTFTVSDRDGNRASASAAYTVDTVPPVLALTSPDSQRVVDVESVAVAGTVYDATAGIDTVTVGGQTAAVENGRFRVSVPLEAGVNEIAVTAVDGAGWTTAQSVTVIRLVTDRTLADTERVRELCARGFARWTAEERAWWSNTRCRRGSYDALDLNRVTAAMEHIAGWLERYGYLTDYQSEPHGPWADGDAMTKPQGTRYLTNVESLRTVLPVPESTPETPRSMERLTVPAANDIEKILVAIDGLRPMLDRASWFPCGTINCGGVF